MRSLPPSSSLQKQQQSRRWKPRYNNKASSIWICWCTILLGIFGCKTGLKQIHNRFDTTDESARSISTYASTSTFWAHSFSPVVSSSFQKNRAHGLRKREWQSLCHNTPLTLPWLPFPLYASGDSQEENDTDGAATMEVLSVFSIPPGKVFRELLSASAGTGTVTTELLGFQDIYEDASTNVDNNRNEGRWDELNEMVADGDLPVDELRDLYDAAVVDGRDGLDLEGFKRLYRSIDDLFDDDDEDEDEEEEDLGVDYLEGIEDTSSNLNNIETESSSKQDLVSYLEELQKLNCYSDDGTVDVGERRPWGLDCSNKERRNILELIERLLAENISSSNSSNSNLLGSNNNINNGRPMSAKDLTKYILGTWDLKYTSSRTMIINKSLSGLGRSTSDMARNLGLKMTLSGSYYSGQAEFVEAFGSSEADDESESELGGNAGIKNNSDGDNDGGSFLLKATVTGEWLLETGIRMDYKTGLPSVSLRVEVETIAYGPTKSDAGQWDSLSPIKLVDILYLDENTMVLRGNANVDAFFVYTRR